ncbi:MAG: hypothetical protein KGO94_12645, partial [Alphaproteobacteria bacterium]|nr:hypothetical protein [Alphaproteobacteria bacterium]
MANEDHGSIIAPLPAPRKPHSNSAIRNFNAQGFAESCKSRFNLADTGRLFKIQQPINFLSMQV